MARCSRCPGLCLGVLPCSGACISVPAMNCLRSLHVRRMMSRCHLLIVAACCAGAAGPADAAAPAEPALERRLLQTALVGAPNAGKSSLANALAGRKVAAVSHRTNTTAACRLAAFTDGAGTQVRVWLLC